MVILLISAIALVNIGRVGVHRLGTANAADSAALAAASALAAVANNIATANCELKLQYAAFLIAIQSTFPNCLHPLCKPPPLGGCHKQKWDFKIYMFYAGWLLLNYMYLMYTSKQGFDMARAQAHRMAFANVGIEEAERRDSRTREILQPPLSKWLNETKFNERRPYTYRWHSYSIDTRTGEEAREPQPNEVTSRVTLSDCAFALDPLPVLIVPKLYKFVYTGIEKHPATKCLVPCSCVASYACLAQDLASYTDWLTREIAMQNLYAKIAFTTIVLTYSLLPYVMGCPVAPDVESIIAAVIALFVPLIIPIPVTPPPYPQCTKPCICGTPLLPTPAPIPAKVLMLYIVPVPWILGIRNDDNITVTSEVTYKEPGRNLGFWRRKGTTVSSRATARMIPGNFQSCEDPDYDAELIQAW